MIRRRRQRGFSLIETLVALAIAVMALNGFYSALSTGVLLGRSADRQAAQMQVAAMILDRVGPVYAVSPGLTENGVAEGMDWTLVISDRPTEDMRLGPIQANELLYVYVTVQPERQRGQPVVLRGIRYAETPL